ncbi:LANO_0B07316g1_1 [Lachancea nothofagi CBS 11611]|uniref:LANO_0B07316g1_1 n=1 Tax=Lachancea nothofagi CBS 11611 TaxID=1266666 RepID=A0A1G4J098_9SACH|nr:LANO_0B07316g1_1 [Lachancea nothofagi CBS 11611]
MNNCKRPDLIVEFKYKPVPKSSVGAASQGIMAQSMPMAAMFMKNKFLAWFSLLLTVHYSLNGEADKKSADQSPLLKILMAVVSLAVCYMNVVFPQPGPAPKKA